MDKFVTREEFLRLYDEAFREMDRLSNLEENKNKTPDEFDNDIYGKEITVHWNGYYCNCGDGAIAYNNIICGVKNCDEEINL